MSGSSSTFWLEDPWQLFRDFQLVPCHAPDLESQFNVFTRLVLVMAVILYLGGCKESLLFVLVTLTLIIILFYLEKGKMSTRENFTDTRMNLFASTAPRIPAAVSTAAANQKRANTQSYKDRSTLFCDDAHEVHFDQRFFSKNQVLAGTANPKTKVMPVMVQRPTDLNYWKASSYTIHSNINDQSREYPFESGYIAQEDCNACLGKTDFMTKNTLQGTFIEGFTAEKQAPKRPQTAPAKNTVNGTVIEGFDFTPDMVNTSPAFQYVPLPPPADKPWLANVPLSEMSDTKYQTLAQTAKPFYQPDRVNIACGYDPDNPKSNLPVNYAAGSCQKKPVFDKFNKNIFTQHAGEDVFFRSDVNTPQTANIGISFDQQFNPTTYEVNEKGFFFHERDPSTYKSPPPPQVDPFTLEPKPDDVYDPRHTGYGPNYRTYIDEMTGRPRFFYDDIDAVRRSNFIVRSKVDHLPNAAQTGVMKGNEEICQDTTRMRTVAQNAYTDAVIGQRVDLQQRLMRKRNADWWQRKIAPISTSGYKAGAGGSAGFGTN
jgi:hypothetical protein